MNFTHAIRRVVQSSPDRPALTSKERTFTYKTLWAAISRSAAWYRDLGLQPGDRVLVWLPNGIEFVAAHFGALSAGLTSVPLKAEVGPVEFDFALRDSRPKLVVADPTLLDRLRASSPSSVPIRRSEEIPVDGSLVDIEPEAVPDAHPASINYSYFFGEGRPYGAVLSHANYHHAAVGFAQFHGIGPEDRTLVVLPMAHVYTLAGALLGSFLRGACVVVARPLRARGLLEMLCREKITRFPSVPQMFEALAAVHDPSRYDLSSIRYLVSGADHLPAAAHQHLERVLGVSIVQGYGLTECFPVICNPNDARKRPGTLGIAGNEDIQYRVVDEEGRVVSAGTTGEIEIKSPTVMVGYWDAPDATARVLREGWLRTGDLGVIGEDGYLSFQGLRKPIINVHGNKVDSVELAAVLRACPGVIAATVQGRTCSDNLLPSVTVAAHVVTAASATLDEQKLRAHCRVHLAPYKIPTEIRIDTMQ